jgi:hypothetical protein
VPTAMPTLEPTNSKRSGGASATLIGAIMGGLCAVILLTLMCYYGMRKSSTHVGFAAAGPGRQSFSANVSGPPVRVVHLPVVSDAYFGGGALPPPPPLGLRSPYSPVRLPPPRLDI